MSKLFTAFLLVTMLAVAFAAEDYCGKCQLMCEAARTKYNNDFTTVTSAQLVPFMEDQCKVQFQNFEVTVCKSVIDKNGDAMLAAFKRGDTNQQICAEGQLC
ncbi:unnamed protein product, partial [Mesorhabditis belari]|uniref:Saposin B-type domain-containing protein n=1 Tax=Mesorhabditis belari TaxID=2138241 RepID=A0AAF3ECQ6_9BILA